MNADAKSFQVLAEDIAKDKDSVYFRNMTQSWLTETPFMLTMRFRKIDFHVYYIDQVLGFGIIKGRIPKHMNW